MATQATDKLVVVDGMPSVEKLWNGRFRLEFFCTPSNKNEGWYGDNIAKWLPEFGTLQGADFTGEGWEALDGEVYPNMCLVGAEVPYIPPSESHLVKLVYETLTASWVEEKDEGTDYELNGLKRVTRTFVALPDTTYDKVVGTDTIDSDGTTLTLGSFSIKETDSKWELTEVWLESGELSRSEDRVGSQQSISIEAIGEIPTTPAGYVLANTQSSNVDGFATNRYTFLEPSILSVSQELVGGATTVQVSAFSLTEAQVSAELSEVTSTHILVSQSEGDYEGIITSQFTYEVDDFEVDSQNEDGMEVISRIELSATSFSNGVIGVDLYKTLFLTREEIDNGNAIKKRTSRYSEAGVLSISPLEEDGFSLAPSYVYVTTGAPASSMTGLVKPNGTALGTDVTWFEPKIQNVEGFSTYTQQVLSIAPATTSKVHSADKFFTITEPGVMSTGGSFNSNEKSGAATRYPKALSQPSTYRKKATVDVYLTSVSSISETEVAFTEEGVDWCSIGFDSFYTNETESTASVSSNWRSFPQYLNSSGTTDSAFASRLGVYYAVANSYGRGDETYTTTGIYRVELEKYTRAVDGTQLYLKTIVTF